MTFPASRRRPLNGNSQSHRAFKRMSRGDEYWMQQALALAKQAAGQDEVPIGAILVKDDRIIGQGFNRPISENDPSAHAEIIALRAAAKTKQNYRLPGTTLYVTLEPCLMCFGALIQARVERLVYGAADKRFGVVAHVQRLSFNHHLEIHPGVMQRECADLLTRYFATKRKPGPVDIAE